MSAPDLNLGERRLPRAKVASILASHGEGADVDRIGYYDSLGALAEKVRSNRSWAEGEIFVSAFDDDRYVIMKQMAPASCELATYTQNGFHDVLTGYRYGQEELVAALQSYAAGKAAPSFTPADGQVQAAQALMVAMAHVGTVRPVVEQYKKAILEEHQFKIDPKFAGDGSHYEGEVILDPKHSWLLGERDFQVYHAECMAARDALGLPVSRPEACPLLEAEHLQIRAENALLKAWEGHPKFSVFANVVKTEEREQVLDLTLALLAPFVKDNAKDMLKDLGIESSVEAPVSVGTLEALEAERAGLVDAVDRANVECADGLSPQQQMALDEARSALAAWDDLHGHELARLRKAPASETHDDGMEP